MEELAGRLTTLDPQASETLKVISYFDTLVDGRASAATLVRSAAVISGATVGFRPASGREYAFEAGGRPVGASAERTRSRHLHDRSEVWFHRGDAEHANDRMVLERLAIALEIVRARTDLAPNRTDATEALISASSSEAQKLIAASALGFTPRDRVRAVAVGDAAHPVAGRQLAAVPTPNGLLGAAVVPAETLLTDDRHPDGTRVGIGTAVPVQSAHESWTMALIALRLTDRDAPVGRADALGSLGVLAAAVDLAAEVPEDVLAVERALTTGWAVAGLRALAEGVSVRGVATAQGLHHSTIQARLGPLAAVLGYDPLTGLGRTRLFAALLLHRLSRHQGG